MSDQAMAALFAERNDLARQLADLRDSYDTLAADAAATQQRWLAERAALRLAAGASEDDLEQRLRDDSEQLAQILYDRVFHEGFVEGLREAERAVEKMRLDATRRGFRDQNA